MLTNDDLTAIAQTFGDLDLGPTCTTMIEDLLADLIRQREKIKGLQALIKALCADAAVDDVNALRRFIALRRSVSYEPEEQ